MPGVGFRVSGFGFRVPGVDFGCMVRGGRRVVAYFGICASGFGFWIHGSVGSGFGAG